MWVLWEAEINQFLTWVSQDLEVLGGVAWDTDVRGTLRTDCLENTSKRKGYETPGGHILVFLLSISQKCVFVLIVFSV